MFWACSISTQKSYEIDLKPNEIIHLSYASITPGSSNDKIYLLLHQGDEKFYLCALQKGKWESHKLDQFLLLKSEDKPFRLSVLGSGKVEVHVSGSLEKEETEMEHNFSDEKPKNKVELETEKIKIQPKTINEEYDSDADLDETEGEDISKLLKNVKKSNEKPIKLKTFEKNQIQKSKKNKKNKKK
jgi:hypothetical protein